MWKLLLQENSALCPPGGLECANVRKREGGDRAGGGWSGSELKRRESAQSPIASKRKLATRVLDNRTGMPELRRQVEELYESLLEIPRQEGN